ncbi:MAG: ectonucleotide pyrophosphatase/phosphodiesterase [Bryobacteraceae bacterium]|nr:ectonucleotide pyrophosphatase/phosphodiesterase [Bryobacteraceae bacterium]
MFLRLLVVLLVLVGGLRGQPRNDPRQQHKPYVLLVGLDGFRFDYADRYGARNLLSLRDRGASAEALVPAYPSLTFPSFYTLATGLYPERHGIVGNRFFDPERGEEFYFRENQSDGSWYGGTPIWVLAEQQGLRTATYFWPGTSAPIQGWLPTFFYAYNPETTREERVRQVLEWFHLPEERRPHLVIVYFSDVDSAGHQYGPDSEETRRAVQAVDRSLGQLLDGLQRVRPAVNVVVVSDHGMMACEPFVDVTDHADFSRFRVVSDTVHVMLYSEDRRLVEETRRALHGKSKLYEVWQREQIPSHLRFRENRRIGDLVIMSTGPHPLSVRLAGRATGAPRSQPRGMHGWDPERFPLMCGIFYAAGPQIRPGVRLKAIRAVDVFPLLSSLLDLEAPGNLDGSWDVAKKVHCRTCPVR